jgi:hypothetical protein
MKALELAMKTIKAGIDDFILEEAGKHEGKSFEFDGHAIQVKETGVKYDYMLCNDAAYHDLKKQAEVLTEKIKERETFLKSINDKMTIVDDESGEVTTVYPPSKSGKTSVTITLKK